MKKYLILLLAVLIVACNNLKENDTINFSGTIDNPNTSGILLSKGEFKKEIVLDESGSFSVLLEDIKEGKYTLWDSVESTKLFLVPGEDLELSMDASSFDETIVYSGPGAAGSNYYAKFQQFEEKSALNYQKLYSQDENGFLASIDSIEKRKLSFLEGFESLPSKLSEMEKKAFHYSTLSFISNYKSAHSYFTKNEDFEPSETFLKSLDDLDLNNEVDYENIDAYKNLVQAYYSSDDMLGNIAKLDQISIPAIKKDVLKSLQYGMRPGSDDLDTIFNGLSKHAVDEEFKADLVSKYEKYKELIKGKPSPQFNYPDINGDLVSLGDLKGKLVYIDVWATWCGPCIREIPDLKILEEEYHDKEIAFVSISVDKKDDMTKWENMVSEKSLKGYQLFSDKDWNSDFVQGYGIQGIPRFILVDKEGNIISADAPRPSSGDKIRSMFEENI